MDCGSLLPLGAGSLLPNNWPKYAIAQSDDPQQAVDRKAAACCRSPREDSLFTLLRRAKFSDVLAQQVRAGDLSFAEEFFSQRRVVMSIGSS